MIKTIGHVNNISYVKKLNKYVADICFLNERKQSIWLTEKQYQNLITNTEKLKNGYSSKYKYVEAVFNENGYYAYCRYVEEKPIRYFNIPEQYDLSCLLEEND